jgi:hypothetical protein
LVIRSIPLEGFVVVVESKVESNFGDTQILDYRVELDDSGKFCEAKTKLLVALTKHNTVPTLDKKHLDACLLWQDVQQVLEEVESEANTPTQVQFVLTQLSQFLKTKGMYHMQLPNTDEQSFRGGILFCRSIHEILLDVRADSEKLRGLFKNPVVRWRDENKCLSMELRCNQPYFVLGFILSPKYSMYVEAHWIRKPVASEDIKDFINKHPNREFGEWHNGFGIEGSFTKDMEGDANKVKEWFNETVDLVLKFRNGN